jgi:hypothetical protein
MTELEVLKITYQRLEKLGIQYMLTGSFAMAWYATPRMTRDLDLVVALEHETVGPLVEAFSKDFYVDAAAARAAVSAERLFNLMHLKSGLKIDLIVRKSSEYRRLEFDRRKRVSFAGTEIWITSCEDLSAANAEGRQTMKDTDDAVAQRVGERHRRMTPAQRMQIASDLFDAARAIVESSLPAQLTQEERRLAMIRRFYRNELPEAVLQAFARRGLDRCRFSPKLEDLAP